MTTMTAEQLWLFENGEEEHVVPLIKAYLRTTEQKEMLYKYDISIEDCLNGRVEDPTGEIYPQINAMFADWNAKLGQKWFNV